MDKRVLDRYYEVSRELQKISDEKYSEVHNIRFAYKNKEIISLLTSRGKYLQRA